MNTGEVIREFRERAGFSQKTLAQALHITDKAVSKWERGLSLPDVALLPKLSLLLDADIDLLLTKSIEEEQWAGLIEIEVSDLSQIVYDKPLVYYLMTHYLLVGITKIHFMTSSKNEKYLKTVELEQFGFEIRFDAPDDTNVMLLTHPWFIFGSDLTEQFQGAMLSKRLTKIGPENRDAVFCFIPKEQLTIYFTDKKRFYRKLNKRNLGRGMMCFDLSNYDDILDAASFVRMYQNGSGFIIGSLEEVAYYRGLIDDEKLDQLISELPYGNLLKRIKKVNQQSVEY